MREEIKQRIEQIRRGEVPEGYKRTKVGIVPEEWDVPKAKEVFESISDKKHDGTLEVLSATQDRGVVPRSQVDIDIKYDQSSVFGYKKVNKGNFVISLRSFQGGIEYSEYDGIVSPAYTVLKEKTEICRYFYKTFFKTDDYIKRLAVATYGIRDGKSISFEDFGMLRIPYPPLAEQEKIAEILQTQDKWIEFQQKKIDELKKLKKVYLSKMFPKKGCNVPEIRFPEFTDPWEQRKFSEIVETRRGLTYKPSDICENGVRVLRSSNIDDDSFVLRDDDVFVKAEAVNIDYTKENDILITAANGSSRLVGKHAIIGQVSPKSTVHGGFMLLGATKEPYFVNASMGSSWYRHFIELFVSGGNGAIGNLNKNDLDNQDILVPSEEERQKIGAFFKQLDHIVTLHQRKLDEEQKKKKALMQLLLTGIVRVQENE